MGHALPFLAPTRDDITCFAAYHLARARDRAVYLVDFAAPTTSLCHWTATPKNRVITLRAGLLEAAAEAADRTEAHQQRQDGQCHTPDNRRRRGRLAESIWMVDELPGRRPPRRLTFTGAVGGGGGGGPTDPARPPRVAADWSSLSGDPSVFSRISFLSGPDRHASVAGALPEPDWGLF